jgi:hypothetical protein
LSTVGAGSFNYNETEVALGFVNDSADRLNSTYADFWYNGTGLGNSSNITDSKFHYNQTIIGSLGDLTNVAFLNNTQTFTGGNTFSSTTNFDDDVKIDSNTEDTLQVQSDGVNVFKVDGANNISLITDGGASFVGLGFLADPDTGLKRIGANTVSIVSGTTESFDVIGSLAATGSGTSFSSSQNIFVGSSTCTGFVIAADGDDICVTGSVDAKEKSFFEKGLNASAGEDVCITGGNCLSGALDGLGSLTNVAFRNNSQSFSGINSFLTNQVVAGANRLYLGSDNDTWIYAVSDDVISFVSSGTTFATFDNPSDSATFFKRIFATDGAELGYEETTGPYAEKSSTSPATSKIWKANSINVNDYAWFAEFDELANADKWATFINASPDCTTGNAGMAFRGTVDSCRWNSATSSPVEVYVNLSEHNVPVRSDAHFRLGLSFRVNADKVDRISLETDTGGGWNLEFNTTSNMPTLSGEAWISDDFVTTSPFSIQQMRIRIYHSGLASDLYLQHVNLFHGTQERNPWQLGRRGGEYSEMYGPLVMGRESNPLGITMYSANGTTYCMVVNNSGSVVTTGGVCT